MRKVELICLLFFTIFYLDGCQREIHFPLDNAEGDLQDNSSGECLPRTVNGDYVKGIALSATANTITVDINVTKTGTYLINSNRVNGYQFTGSGNFSATGIHTVILQGSGTPLSEGIDHFQISFNNQSCDLAIEVDAGGGQNHDAVFTLSGSPGNCSAVINGQYESGVALGTSNTVSLTVNVTTIGNYSISTTTIDGMSFSVNGSFTTTGTNSILLQGIGIPAADGNFTFPLTAGSSICSYAIPVGKHAVFTEDCSNVVINGTYQVGMLLATDNFLALSVNVSQAGYFSITTPAVNGMQFSSSGTLVAGIQTIMLVGSGIPVTAEVSNIPLTGTCNVPVTVDPANSGIRYEWKFSAGAGTSLITYQGTTADAIVSSSNGVALLKVQGNATSGNGHVEIILGNTIGIISGANYSGTSTTGMFATFTYTDGGPINYMAAPTIGSNLPVVLTNYSTSSHIVEGTFSGTVIDRNGVSVTITDGTFRANLPR